MTDAGRLEKWRCPGVHRGIMLQECPECGGEVEFFPSDVEMTCLDCGTLVTRASGSCLTHCPAKQSSCYRQMVRREVLADQD